MEFCLSRGFSDASKSEAFRQSSVPRFCTLYPKLIVPSFFVLFLSSITGTLLNALFSAASIRLLDRYRSALKKRQHLLQVSQHAQVVPIEEGSPIQITSDSFSTLHRAFFQNMDNTDKPEVLSSPESPVLPVASPVLNEALFSSLQELRFYSQQCFFDLHAMYLSIACFKCLAMIVVIQYLYGDIHGGWLRLCICGSANITSGSWTPVLEFLSKLMLPVDTPSVSLDAPVKSAGVQNSESDRSGPRDSVYIVEILLQVEQLKLTDLRMVFIQCSSFMVAAASFLPFFVFWLAGISAWSSWLLLFVVGLYVLVRRAYYIWENSPLGKFLYKGNARVGVFLEFLKAAVMKTITLFVLQLCIIIPLLLGIAVLNGMTVRSASEFLFNSFFSVRLYSTSDSGLLKWIILLSQLLF